MIAPEVTVPVDPRYEKQFVSVLGKQMAYVEYISSSIINSAVQDTIVFVHGNPTSSYMWRNVMPHCENLNGFDGVNVRLIAPDLIGMGSSEKLNNIENPLRYSLKEQYRYFANFLEAINVRERVVFVVHSWGTTLAARWASENFRAVRGLVLLESVFEPFKSWEHVPEKMRPILRLLKTPPFKVCCFGPFDISKYFAMNLNAMIQSIPDRVSRKDFGEAEMKYYRQGFESSHPQGLEARRPILTFLQSIPVAGDPPEAVQMMNQGKEWLMSSNEIPILFFNVKNGTLMPGDRDFIRNLGMRVTEIEISGKHMATEDSPDDIGKEITKWFQEKVRDEQ